MTFRFRKTRKKKCGKKMSYRTIKAAHKARRIIYRRGGPHLWVYRCDKCKRFHLTGEAATEYEREDDNERTDRKPV